MVTSHDAPTRAADRLTLQQLLDLQRAAFLSDGIPDAATRIDRIERLQAMVLDNADALVDALAEDFGTRPRELSLNADVVGSMTDLDHQKKHLTGWMGDTVPRNLLSRLGVKQRVRHDPKGVVGIIGPWNFPVQLTVVPAGSAFAAGNRVLLRPSEITARTLEVLADLAPAYFSLEELAVVTKAHGDGADFSRLAFDHLFFTGSPVVGARVAEGRGAQPGPGRPRARRQGAPRCRRSPTTPSTPRSSTSATTTASCGSSRTRPRRAPRCTRWCRRARPSRTRRHARSRRPSWPA